MMTVDNHTALKNAEVKHGISHSAALKICVLKKIKITTISRQNFLKNEDVPLFDSGVLEDKPNRRMRKSKDILYRQNTSDEFHYSPKGGSCDVDTAKEMFKKYERLMYATIIKSIKKYRFSPDNIPICQRSASVKLWDMCLQKGEKLTSIQVFNMAQYELFRVYKHNLVKYKSFSRILSLNLVPSKNNEDWSEIIELIDGYCENPYNKIEAKDIIEKTCRVLSEYELNIIRMYYAGKIDTKGMAKNLNLSITGFNNMVNSIIKKLKREYLRLKILSRV